MPASASSSAGGRRERRHGDRHFPFGDRAALVKVAEEKNLILHADARRRPRRLPAYPAAPTSIHFLYDTYGQTKTIVNALAKQGDASWFFLTVDYAFGLAIQQDATEFNKATWRQDCLAGAPSAQHCRLFSSIAAGRLVEGQDLDGRQRRRRDIIIRSNWRRRFGLIKKGVHIQRAPRAVPSDIHGIGLQIAQGLPISSPFDYDMTPDGPRTFTDRFAKEIGRPALLHPRHWHLRRRAALPQGRAGRRHR